jgi:hypothetical protein
MCLDCVGHSYSEPVDHLSDYIPIPYRLNSPKLEAVEYQLKCIFRPKKEAAERVGCFLHAVSAINWTLRSPSLPLLYGDD